RRRAERPDHGRPTGGAVPDRGPACHLTGPALLDVRGRSPLRTERGLHVDYPLTQEADQSTRLPADEALIAPWGASAVSLACPARWRLLSAANSGMPRSSDGSTTSRATRSNRRLAPIDRYRRA